MKKICISKDWLRYSNVESDRYGKDYIRYTPAKEEWKKLDLPDDYAVVQPRDIRAPGGAANGYFVGGTATYLKYTKIAEEPCHVILDIDGAYMNAEIYFNDDKLAEHPHGYTPFLVDLTDHVRFGRTNKLSIFTNDSHPSTRWYSGAGLYRDVFLWTGGEVRVEPWDLFITTPEADESGAKVVLSYQIASDVDGEAVVKAEIPGVATAAAQVTVKKGEKVPVELELTVTNPRLWSVDTPELYQVLTEISLDGQITDTAENTFGIRTISFDAVHGFRLNGKSMKMRGGCIHHDHGVLGAASFPAAEERKVRLLKEAGFNALRIAHNPPSLALLEVCDRLGMLVMDEAFDMWNCRKRAGDYHLWFRDWWQRDISYMVLRDRNHPCVMSYSIGNEILERTGNSDGVAWAKKLGNQIRSLDPTRPVTSGIHGFGYRPEPTDPEDYVEDTKKLFEMEDVWAEVMEGYMATLDIVGYNYQWRRYKIDHELYPDRVMWGSETHALEFYDSWNAIMENDQVLGDFTWTAYDNLGEAGTGRFLWARDGYIPGINLAPYPWRSCYQGDLDLCGYRRPQSYFREAIWIGGKEPKIFTTHPDHYGEGFSGTHWHWYDVHETWTFDDAWLGKPVKADVYTDADEILWFLNGRELGSSKPEKGIATMDIPYEKGVLSVKAVKNGVVVGESSLHTVGEAAQIRVEPEKPEFAADNRDLCYFRITVEDSNGDRIPHGAQELSCLVDGGELMGIFSGDPANEDAYGSNRCHAFGGRALAIVRTKNPGKVTVTVGTAGLKSGTATVEAK